MKRPAAIPVPSFVLQILFSEDRAKVSNVYLTISIAQ